MRKQNKTWVIAGGLIAAAGIGLYLIKKKTATTLPPPPPPAEDPGGTTNPPITVQQTQINALQQWITGDPAEQSFMNALYSMTAAEVYTIYRYVTEYLSQGRTLTIFADSGLYLQMQTLNNKYQLFT